MGSTTRGMLTRLVAEGRDLAGDPHPEHLGRVRPGHAAGDPAPVPRRRTSRASPKPAHVSTGSTCPALVLWGQRDPWLSPQLGRSLRTAAPAGHTGADRRGRPLAVARRSGRRRPSRGIHRRKLMRAYMQPKWIAPTAVAALFAIAYVIVEPPSLDLAAHLLRAKLFSAEGFGIWNNWWYAGHNVPGYSVLFPPIAALLTPQVAAGIATTGTAALFTPLVRRHFGEDAWLGAMWFGARDRDEPVHGTADVRVRPAAGDGDGAGAPAKARRDWPACWRWSPRWRARWRHCSPHWAPPRTRSAATSASAASPPPLPGAAAVVAALLPVLLLTIAFPEGGSEPFTLATLWPIIAITAVALAIVPRREWTIRAGIVAVRDRLHRLLQPRHARRQQCGPARAAGSRAPGRFALVQAPGRVAGGNGPAAALLPVAGPDPGRSNLGRRPVRLGGLLPAAARVPRAPDRSPVPGRDPVHAIPLGGLPGGAQVPAGARLGAAARHQVQPPVLRRSAERGDVRHVAAPARRPFRGRARTPASTSPRTRRSP